jgi:tetratricopeptide (TPR) repeat protein
LGPLRKQESIALIGEFIDTTDALAASCLERAAGNPLFLEQLLRNAEEGGGDNLPDSIQTLVLARLDRLRPGEKRALQAASVLGQRFGSEVLSHLLGVAAYDCSKLLEHNLIRAQDDGYLFAHALIQESVYGSLLKRERMALHKSAADWFAHNDRVLHAQHLDMAGDEQACAAYLEAAEEQARQYRYDSALHLIERALQLGPRQSDRHPLTCLKAELLLAMGSIESSITVFRDTERCAENDLQRCDAWMGIAANMRVKTQYEDGLVLLEKAEPVATQHGLVGELSRLHHLRGNLLFSLARADECRHEHSIALAFAEQAHSPEREARALGGLGDAEYVRGRMQTAHDYYSRCIELARQHGLGQVEVAHVGQRGWTRLFTGDWQGAKSECITAIELASKVGDRRAEMNSSQCLSDCVLELGEYELTETYLARTLALAESLGARAWRPQALVCKALLGLAHGRQQEARVILKEALEITRDTGRAFQRARVLGTLAWVDRDDNDAREAALSEGEEILGEDVVSHNYFWFYRSAMDTMLYLNDWERVERYASALEDYTLEEPLGWTDFFVARARALADFGRGKRGEATLKELERLRDVADTSGLKITVAAINNALTIW